MWSRAELARIALASFFAVLVLQSCAAARGPTLDELRNATWILVSVDRLPVSGVDRPPTAEFDGSRVSGFSGCNRYFGQVTEKSPGEIAVGPLAGTRMACPGPAMELENRFYSAMSRVTRYAFVNGRLVLSATDGGAPRELTFERHTR